MPQETFVNYRNFRWFWINLATLGVLTAIYCLHHPVGGRNGGTALGYTYGVLAAAGIGALMWFGIRKRSYTSSKTTLKGCLAVHVWLGLALLLLVPLHCGFSFGMNVHTLAYALMCLTIVSGMWGALAYRTLADKITSHRGGGALPALLEQVELIAGDVEKLAANKADTFMKLIDRVDFEYTPGIAKSLFGDPPPPINRKEAGELIAQLPEGERDDGFKLISLVNQKSDLYNQVNNEIKTLSLMRLWLYLHLPLSIGLVGVLCVHIFSVFYYW